MVLRLRGGGPGPDPIQEMTIAAGGKIHQVIHEDEMKQDWLAERTTVFNVQILNSLCYKAVTGRKPPTKPINAARYKQNGLPFYAMYEEPSGVSGDFSMVKSVAQIDGVKDGMVKPAVKRLNHSRAGRK